MNVDFTIPGATTLLASSIARHNDDTGEKPGKYSWRVKPSSLAGECLAKLWYGYRWAAKGAIPAKLQRIFDVGNESEKRFVSMFRRAGWTVLDIDPAKEGKKFPQWNITDFGGHLSAYADAIACHPEFTNNVWILHEYKTMNKRDFSALVAANSVAKVKMEYYGQHIIYLKKFNLPYGLITVECKDNQELYYEIILPNDEYASKLLSYGETIVTTRTRPSRVAESPAYYFCKMCDFKDICHYGTPVDVNCRSCVHAEAVDGGQFRCNKWEAIIPNEDAIKAACPKHEPVK